jgi:hypothetical protein
MMTNTGSIGPLEGVHVDWMVSPDLASASLCLTVILSSPWVSEVPVFMRLIRSNPALSKPGAIGVQAVSESFLHLLRGMR